MHGLILAGGEGSRLRSDGIVAPKPFVSLSGRPLLFRLGEVLYRLGCESVTAVVRRTALSERDAMQVDQASEGLRILPCETPSSLHTLAEGIAAMPPGPLLCTMVDSVMRESDWRGLFVRAGVLLQAGADACVAVTPFVDDEVPLYVATRPDGTVTRFQAELAAPPLVTGGVYFLSSRVRDLAPRVLDLGISRMRGFLQWLVEHGYQVQAVEVERIVDLDRSRDLAMAEAWLAQGAV